MSDNIENVIWYSLGAFDYFLDKEHFETQDNLFQASIYNRKDILSNEDEELIKNQIKSFNYSEDVLNTKRLEIKKNFQGRSVYNINNELEINQARFILDLFKEGGYSALDNLILSITTKIDNKEICSSENILSETLNNLAAFCYVNLIEEITVLDSLKYQSNAVVLLNSIIDLDEYYFDDVDDIKQKFYPLIRNLIFELYQNESERENIIIFLKSFEILDLFTIFNWNIQLFPISLVEYLIKELVEDNEREPWPVNRYHCLKMFLLDNLDPLDEEYLILYERFFTLENDNALLVMALRAQYCNNLSLCRKLYSKIDRNNLNDFFDNYYCDLSEALEKSNEEEFKTYKNKNEIISIIDSGDMEKLDSYLMNFDTSNLSRYCLNECTKHLLDKKMYNVIEAEAILYKNPTSLYNYLSRSSEYIKEKDIASLYIFSTILLNLNLINESYILLKRILEIIDCEDILVMNTLKLQLVITKKFLGYIV